MSHAQTYQFQMADPEVELVVTLTRTSETFKPMRLKVWVAPTVFPPSEAVMLGKIGEVANSPAAWVSWVIETGKVWFASA